LTCLVGFSAKPPQGGFLLAAAGERLPPGAVSSPVRRYAVADPMETA